jgi:hypothetical protein
MKRANLNAKDSLQYPLEGYAKVREGEQKEIGGLMAFAIRRHFNF